MNTTTKLEETKISVELFTALSAAGFTTLGSVAKLSFTEMMNKLESRSMATKVVRYLDEHGMYLRNDEYTENGYYWVKVTSKSDWQIYRYHNNRWLTLESAVKIRTSRPFVVGPHIVRPI